jgi:hypothetical protein
MSANPASMPIPMKERTPYQGVFYDGKPYVGEIVLYRTANLSVLPAIVVKVHDDGQFLVDLQVFGDYSLGNPSRPVDSRPSRVPYSDAGSEHTWSRLHRTTH